MIGRTATAADVSARRRGAVVVGALAVLAPTCHWAWAAEPTPPALSQAAFPRERMGLDLAMGFGSIYGTIGLQARFDVPVRRWLLVAPFLGGGLFFKEGSGVGAAPAAGVSLSVGHRFRLAVDLGVGPVALVDLDVHGTAVDTRTLLGPLVALGLEVARENGAYVRASIGAAWPEWPSLVSSRATLVINVGAGVRAL